MPGWPWRSTSRVSGTWSWTPTSASRRSWARRASVGRDRYVDIAPRGVRVRAHLVRGLGQRAGRLGLDARDGDPDGAGDPVAAPSNPSYPHFGLHHSTAL